MTIDARRLLSPIGRMDRVEFTLEGSGWTLGKIADTVRSEKWPENLPLEALVNGKLVRVDENREMPIHDGDDVSIAPTFGASFAVYAFATFALAIVSQGLSRALAPKTPQIERGEEASPTYNFRGIGTQSGPGGAIAMGYGKLRVGQQFISSKTILDPTGRWTDSETILVQIALGVGPWYSIGGLGLGVCGEADFLGGIGRGFRPLPAGLRVNDTAIQETDPNVVAHVRSGTIGQSPMPHGLDDVSTLYGLTSYSLTRGNPRVYTCASNEVDRLVLEWRFPQGLYRASNGGQTNFRDDANKPLEFQVRFRKSGELIWGAPDQVVIDKGEPAPGAFSWTKTYDLPELAQWEVEIVRTTDDDKTASGGNFTISTSELESVTEQRLTRLSYPQMAVLGLEVQGNERIDGDLTSVTVPCEMRMLKRWDGAAWTSREWVNSSDSSKLTGKNPAWIIVDLLTTEHYAGGALGYTLDDIDTASFTAFADYCDELVPKNDTQDEPRHECNLYFDADVESIDEAIQRVCNMCRAVYIREGSKHRIAFDHTKSRSLMLTSERVNNVSLRYRNVTDRPTSYVMQILDEDQDYDLVEVNVEDKDAKIDVTSLDRDQLWQERVNLQGVTRRSAAVREAEHRHRANFLRDMEISFDVTRYALPLDILDRFALSLYVPRWYATVDQLTGVVTDDDAPYHARAIEAGTSVNGIKLDRDITLVSGTTWQVAIQTSTSLEIRTVSGVPGTGSLMVPAGTALLFTGAAVTHEADVQVVVGRSDKVVMDFIVLSKNFDPQSMKQTITAEKYDETVYDVGSATAPLGTGEAIEAIAGGAILPAIDRAAPAVTLVRAELTQSGENLRVDWVRPEGRGYRFRVYSRAAGGTTPWALHGETSDSFLLIPPTELGKDIELSVTAREDGRTWAGPDTGVQITVQGQEFPINPPPDVLVLEATQLAEGFRWSWSDAASKEIDYYEIRRGPQWFGAQVVARTRDTSFHVRDARPHYRKDTQRGENYMLRARARNGLYSPNVSGGLILANPPDGMTLDVPGSQLEFDLNLATGTMVGCSLDSSGITATQGPVLRMDPGVYEASYTLPELDPGSTAQRWWSLAAGAKCTDLTPLGHEAPRSIFVLTDSFGVEGQYGVTASYAKNSTLKNHFTFNDSLNGRALEGGWILAQDTAADILVVELGINDIILNDPLVTLQSQVQVYKTIAKARKLVIANVSPFGNSILYTAGKEAIRAAYNAWLPTIADEDTLIWDIDAVLRDPGTPTQLLGAYNSGDWLHPNQAGHDALQASLETLLLQHQVIDEWAPNNGVNEQLTNLSRGELHYRTVNGRDPSPQKCGADGVVRSDDATIQVDDPGYTACGRTGVEGYAVRVQTQLRIWDAVALQWGGWADWTAQTLTSNKVQGRVLMERADLRYEVELQYVQLVRAN